MTAKLCLLSVGWYITNLIISHHCVSQEFAAHEDTDDDIDVSDDANDVSDIAAAPAQSENTRTSTPYTSARAHLHTFKLTHFYPHTNTLLQMSNTR